MFALINIVFTRQNSIDEIRGYRLPKLSGRWAGLF